MKGVVGRQDQGILTQTQTVGPIVFDKCHSIVIVQKQECPNHLLYDLSRSPPCITHTIHI